MAIDALIFVYNAKSGTIQSLMDSAHKALSPATYSCHLCKLTHGIFGEKRIWNIFISKTKVQFHFYHKNDFKLQLSGIKPELPVILKEENGELEILLNREDLEQLKSVEELITKLSWHLRTN